MFRKNENDFEEYKKSLPTPLSEKEELEIYQRIIKGNNTAREVLFERNLKLVTYIAERYYRNIGRMYLDIMDFVQDGNIGLYKAAYAFDPMRGCKFSSLASRCIQTEMSRKYRETNNTMKYLEADYKKIKMYNYVIKKYYYTYGFYPEKEEIAEKLGWSVEEVKRISSYIFTMISIDQPIGADDKPYEIKDTLAANNCVEEEAMIIYLKNELEKIIEDCNISKRDLEIFSFRKGIGGKEEKTLLELARMYKKTSTGIAEIEKKVLQKLRMHPKMKHFVNYLDNPTAGLEKLEFLRETYRINGKVTQKDIEEYNKGKSLEIMIPVNKRGIHKGKKIKSLRSRLKITQEEYQSVYEQLLEDERQLIYRGYGADIENPVRSSTWTGKDEDSMEKLCKKIQRIVAKNRKIQENLCEPGEREALIKQKKLGKMPI